MLFPRAQAKSRPELDLTSGCGAEISLARSDFMQAGEDLGVASLYDGCTLPDWAVKAPGTTDNPFFSWSHGKNGIWFGLILLQYLFKCSWLMNNYDFSEGGSYWVLPSCTRSALSQIEGHILALKYFFVYCSGALRVPISVSLGSFSAINDFSKMWKTLQKLKALVMDRNFVNVWINYTCGF